jgi:hypothetical protein
VLLSNEAPIGITESRSCLTPLSSPIRLGARNGAEHGAIAEFQRLQWMQTDMSIALAAGAGQPVAHRSPTLSAVANGALTAGEAIVRVDTV